MPCRSIVLLLAIVLSGCGQRITPEQKKFVTTLTAFLDHYEATAKLMEWQPDAINSSRKAEMLKLFAAIPEPPASLAWAKDAYKRAEDMNVAMTMMVASVEIPIPTVLLGTDTERRHRSDNAKTFRELAPSVRKAVSITRGKIPAEYLQ